MYETSHFITLLVNLSNQIQLRERASYCDDKFSPLNWETESSRTEQQQLGEITL